jgi:hypothetical protein
MQIHHLVQGFYEGIEHSRKFWVVPIDRVENIFNDKKEKESDIPLVKPQEEALGPKIFQFKPKQKN